MNDFTHPFDPDLKPVFSKTAYRAASRYRQDGRSLLYLLLQNSRQPAVYPMAYHFIDRHLSATEPPETTDAFGGWDSESLQIQSSRTSAISLTEDRLKACLTQALPVILSEPCWLQGALPTAANQSKLALDLTAVYHALTKDDSVKNRFQALLLLAGLEIPALTSMSFVQQKTIDDDFFDFAALQWGLALFPRVFFPEILGFTLAYSQSPCLLEQFSDHTQSWELSDYIKFRRNRLSSVRPALAALIRDALAEFEMQGPSLAQRIALGFGLYCQINDRCLHRLRDRLEHSESSYEALAKIVAGKVAAAFGHHRHVMLGGRALDDWFGERPFDSANFITSLIQSSYIDRENPAASPLLRLFEFNGPMFGVLTETEKIVLQHWLMQGPVSPATLPSSNDPAAVAPCLPNENGGESIPYGKLSNRELYYYLVNADRFPEVLPAARGVVERVLLSARWFSRSPFKQYRSETFSSYIDSLYQREMKAFEPLGNKPKLSRQAYVWGIEQLAPAILTDGCWLQQTNRLFYTSHHTIGALLYRIFDDENGNGILEQNHPYIYHQLLKSLDIDLPPIYEQSFCRRPAFIDNAFDIPVYLMSIAQFPQDFLPELLGLNMAIELSGLGRVYLRLSQELQYWGIDPTIVSVHITIDNLASGHAALSRNAIQLYLDQIASDQGESAMQAHWRRVCHGYGSLTTVGRPFTYFLIGHYLYKRFKDCYTTRHFPIRRFDQNV